MAEIHSNINSASNAAGVNLSITAGSATSGDNYGGDVNITSGNSFGAIGDRASQISITGGNNGALTGATIYVAGGDDDGGNGGNATVQGGGISTGNGGSVQTKGGDGSGGGGVDISGGDGVGTDKNGGNVTITVGNNTGTGTKGRLSITGLPTSSAGLSSGNIWVDTTGGNNILKIV